MRIHSPGFHVPGATVECPLYTVKGATVECTRNEMSAECVCYTALLVECVCYTALLVVQNVVGENGRFQLHLRPGLR